MTELHIIDAFTSKLFSGNPAAVCLLAEPGDADWMQALAAELNFSETAFPVPIDGGYHLRWFTPAREVALCGHATLASAHALWDTGRLAATDPAVFQTLSGELTAKRVGDRIELNFPARESSPTSLDPKVEEALGVTPVVVHKTQENDPRESDWIIELESETALRAARPNFARLSEVTAGGVIITALGDEDGTDFVSRYFAPAAGINEDPVTGSTHCALNPYWAHKLDRPKLVGFQASKRGGFVETELEGDRVFLRGHAVTVLRGTL